MVVCAKLGGWAEVKTNAGKRAKHMVLDDVGEYKICCHLLYQLYELLDIMTLTLLVLEIYKSICSVIGRMKAIIRKKDSTLEFYDKHILPII